MVNIPKPPKGDRIVPNKRDVDIWRRPENDIGQRQERINESDDSYMQAPDPWPDPPAEDAGDA
jgi:hypothetical protein